MSVLQDSAMLVSISISSWSARKHDKGVSAEVDKTHGAQNGGRYNKQLIVKSALEPIERVEGAARAYFYKVTFAWADNGGRLLPAALFLDFSREIDKFRREFNTKVRDFVDKYPDYKQEARARLGSMYNPDEYPIDIRDKFEFPPVSVMPIPQANDFRVQLSDGYVDSIKADIEARNRELLDKTHKECWTRMREHLERIAKCCGDEKARLFDTMIDTPTEFLAMLPAMNLTNDLKLTEYGDALRTILVPVDRLRNDKRLRAEIARRASLILTTMP